MSAGHLDRLVSRFAESPHPLFTDGDFTDLRAALADLKRLQAEREAWLNGASQRLRHAYRSGWDDRGERDAQALMVRGGFHEAEVRAAAYAAEWWDRGAVLAAEIAAGAQQSERGGSGCPCGCPVVEGMCSCPEPCPCEPDCEYCLVPNPMRGPDQKGSGA